MGNTRLLPRRWRKRTRASSPAGAKRSPAIKQRRPKRHAGQHPTGAVQRRGPAANAPPCAAEPAGRRTKTVPPAAQGKRAGRVPAQPAGRRGPRIHPANQTTTRAQSAHQNRQTPRGAAFAIKTGRICKVLIQKSGFVARSGAQNRGQMCMRGTSHSIESVLAIEISIRRSCPWQ